MSKLLAIVTSLKAILIAASVAFARGDVLPVILISLVFNFVRLGAKPVGQAVPRDTIVVSRRRAKRKSFHNNFSEALSKWSASSTKRVDHMGPR
jgi:hypothetical protein